MNIIALLPGSKYTLDMYDSFEKNECRVYESSDLQLIYDDAITIVKNADLTSLVRQYKMLPSPKSLIIIYPDISERVMVLKDKADLESFKGTLWEDLITLQNSNRKEINLVSYSQVFFSPNKASRYFKKIGLSLQLNNNSKRLAKLEYLLYSYLINTNAKLSILNSRLHNNSNSLLEEEFANESIQEVIDGISEYEDKLKKSNSELSGLKKLNSSLLEEKNELTKNIDVLNNENFKHIDEKKLFLKKVGNIHNKNLSIVEKFKSEFLQNKNRYEKAICEKELKHQKEKIGLESSVEKFKAELLQNKNKYEKAICEKELKHQKEKIGLESSVEKFKAELLQNKNKYEKAICEKELKHQKEKIGLEKQLTSLQEFSFQKTIKINTFELNQYYENCSKLQVLIKRVFNKVRLVRPSQNRLYRTIQNANFLLESGYFDTERYYNLYPDVKESGEIAVLHYLLHGYKEGRSPSQQFDPKKYLEANKDFAEEGVNPLLHYLAFGKSEGRPLGKVVKHKD